jgi:hypothetical protein
MEALQMLGFNGIHLIRSCAKYDLKEHEKVSVYHSPLGAQMDLG